jgi:hypothetical protein
MSVELKQVACGCSSRVNAFIVYDVNGYRFHTRSHEETQPGRKTTCIGVCMPSNDGLDYYGIVEEIYKLEFQGPNALKLVVFKCHWFDPNVTRTADDIGQVKI